MNDNKFKLGELKQKFEQLKQRLPKKVSDESRSFFMKSFAQGAFTDESLQKWPEVDRRTAGTNAYKYPKGKGLSRRTKPIMVRTGRLRNSIRITQLSFNRSVIATDVPYANYLNQGTKYIKKRKFMGRSKTLDRRVNALIKKEIRALFK